MLLLTLALAAFIIPDVLRGRGYVCVAVLALFVAAGFVTPIGIPLWLGGLLTVGVLKSIGVSVHAEAFGLKIITTPEVRGVLPEHCKR